MKAAFSVLLLLLLLCGSAFAERQSFTCFSYEFTGRNPVYTIEETLPVGNNSGVVAMLKATAWTDMYGNNFNYPPGRACYTTISAHSWPSRDCGIEQISCSVVSDENYTCYRFSCSWDDYSEYCTSFESITRNDILPRVRQECEETGRTFRGDVYQVGGKYCVRGDCDVCRTQGWRDYVMNYRIENCCQGGQGTEPDTDISGSCILNMGYPAVGVSESSYNPMGMGGCTDILAGGGDNLCGKDFDKFCKDNPGHSDCGGDGSSSSGDDGNSSSSLCIHVGGCASSDSGSSDSGGGSSGSGGSSDSGGGSSGSDGGGSSGSDGGGGSSDSGGGGGSSDSGGGGGGSSGSGGGVYWCDLHPNDPICEVSGYDDYCETHPNEPFCVYSRDCSQNPYDPNCGPPRRPDIPPSGWDGGGNSGSSGTDTANAVSCKNLKNCDWSTLEKQLVQLGVDMEVRDSIKSIIEWLKYKSHEDSLIAALRWNQEREDRKKMIEISETINGRIFAYYAEQKGIANSQLATLNRMDSLSGLYYASSLSGLEGNRKSLDTLRSKLLGAIGDGADDIVDAVERLNYTLATKNMVSNVNVDVEGADMSGVEGGLAEISDGVSNTNNLLGRLDSTLSSGNSNILAALDSLSGSCAGDQCGDYSGVGDDAFGGLDTSGRYSRAGFDSLLSAPGSGGLRDSGEAVAARIRQATQTPFMDGMACPASDLSIDACHAFGSECRVSLCDNMFYVRGRHVFEWAGLFAEFVAWVLFLVRVA
jgi:hypothetical protein